MPAKTQKKTSKTIISVREFAGQAIDPNADFGNYGVPVPENLIDMVDAYQLHPWVYSAVSVIATHFASIQYEIFLKGKDKTEDLKHPFQKILSQPNPYMTGFDLREFTAISLEMTGAAYWKLERDGSGVPYEAWPVPSHMIKIVSTKVLPIDHYVYSVDGRMIRFDYSDVIQFSYQNPKHSLYGQSSVLAARNEITADLFAALWNKNFFKNSGRPDAILETDASLDPETRIRMATAWKQMHSGVSNAHKMAILEQGTKYKSGGTSQKDMDFITQRKYSREMILSVFNVPPALVGVLEFANYANMEQQLSMFWYMMAAKIKRFEETLSMRAAQTTFRPNSVVVANLEVVKALQPDFKTLSETAKNFVNMGIPINSVIDALDLPFDPVEGGDVSAGLVTTRETGNAVPEPGAPATPPADPNAAKALNIKAAVPADKLKPLQREYRWKSFETDIKDREDRFEGALRGYFKGQRRRVLDNFKKHAHTIVGEHITDKGFLKTIGQEIMAKVYGKVQNAVAVQINLIFEEGKEQKLMDGVVARPITKTYFDFAAKTGKSVNPDFDYNLQDPVALHWIDHKKVKIVREANEYTRERLSEETVTAIEEGLSEGLSESETIAQITDRIDEIYDFAIKGRSTRIARTEIISASNAGAQDGMKAAGATQKEWLATSDDKTRESHALLDGEVVGVSESFVSPISGEQLAFPGDPSADPSEIVNCRCALIPVVD